MLQPGADLPEAGVLADRGGAGAAQLDAVVGGGVVAGGEHRAGKLQRAGGVVEVVGRAHAGVDDVGAPPGGALGERRGQRRGRGAHVAGDHHGVAAGQLDERGADLPRELGVELVGNHPPDVVGLDELCEVCHRVPYSDSNSWVSNLSVRAFSVTVRRTSSSKPPVDLASISTVMLTSASWARPSCWTMASVMSPTSRSSRTGSRVLRP